MLATIMLPIKPGGLLSILIALAHDLDMITLATIMQARNLNLKGHLLFFVKEVTTAASAVPVNEGHYEFVQQL